MLNIFAITLIVSVYLSFIGAEHQNSRNADAMLENTPSGSPPRQEYRERYQYDDVINIGNGNGRRNFVVINENPRRPISTDGTLRNTGKNQQNGGGTRTDQNVNFSIRFGEENIPPVTNSNTRPVDSNLRRGTIFNNIGNGAGNSNWVVIQDTPNGGRTVSTVPYNNFQNPNNNPYNNAENAFRRQPLNSNIPYTRIYNRIGQGPNNYNRVTYNGQTIYDTDLDNQKRQGEQFLNNYNPYNNPNSPESILRRQPTTSNIPFTRIYNSIGSGPSNIVTVNGKTFYDTDLGNQMRRSGQFKNTYFDNLDDDTLKVLPLTKNK